MTSYCPDRGEIVWIAFTPQAGHEQAGRRPALTLSPRSYNKKTGLAIFCPITSQIKGYPFEIQIPEGLKISGAVLADHVKNLDWKARKTQFCCRVSGDVMQEVIGKLEALIQNNKSPQ